MDCRTNERKLSEDYLLEGFGISYGGKIIWFSKEYILYSFTEHRKNYEV